MAPHDGAASHDARADAGSDGDDEEVLVTAAGAEQRLCERQGVDVVVDQDGEAGRVAQGKAQGQLAPAELGGVHHALALLENVARQSDAHSEQIRVGGVGAEGAHGVGESRECHGVGRVELLGRGAGHGAAEADLYEREVIRRDLDADRAEAARGETEQLGRTSAAGGAVLQFGEKSVGEEVPCQLRDEGGGESKAARQIGTRRRAVSADVREDGRPVCVSAGRWNRHG